MADEGFHHLADASALLDRAPLLGADRDEGQGAPWAAGHGDRLASDLTFESLLRNAGANINIVQL